jgi:hypothetical protein
LLILTFPVSFKNPDFFAGAYQKSYGPRRLKARLQDAFSHVSTRESPLVTHLPHGTHLAVSLGMTTFRAQAPFWFLSLSLSIACGSTAVRTDGARDGTGHDDAGAGSGGRAGTEGGTGGGLGTGGSIGTGGGTGSGTGGATGGATGSGGAAGSSANDDGGSAKSDAGGPGSVTLRLALPTTRTFCDQIPACATQWPAHIVIFDDSGSAVTTAKPVCATACAPACQVHICTDPCVAAMGVSVTTASTEFKWDGTAYSSSKCGTGIACYEQRFVSPGHYRAHMCATPGTLIQVDGSFNPTCFASGSTECVDVAFDLPSPAVVEGSLP